MYRAVQRVYQAENIKITDVDYDAEEDEYDLPESMEEFNKRFIIKSTPSMFSAIRFILSSLRRIMKFLATHVNIRCDIITSIIIKFV